MPPSDAATDSPYCLKVLGGVIRVDSPLVGAHQHRNVALAIAAAVELVGKHGFSISGGAIAEGIRKTSWPARLERIERDGVRWILDVAHNPAGAWALRAGLSRALSDESKAHILIFSCLRDKPVAEMAQILFPLFDLVIIPPIHTARAAALEDLLAAAEATGTPAMAVGSVSEALQVAVNKADGGLVVVSGSVYLVGEARPLLLEVPEQISGART